MFVAPRGLQKPLGRTDTGQHCGGLIDAEIGLIEQLRLKKKNAIPSLTGRELGQGNEGRVTGLFTPRQTIPRAGRVTAFLRASRLFMRLVPGVCQPRLPGDARFRRESSRFLNLSIYFHVQLQLSFEFCDKKDQWLQHRR